MDKNKILAVFNKKCKNTLMETLDIKFIDLGVDFLTAKMPVGPKVHQPYG
ncbi:thioesterase, partial [Polaribacter sp.]|nr:thioesterase [Polaribacter sp.]